MNTENIEENVKLSDEYVVILMKPVYTSMQYGISVLGGVFVCLGLLSILQHGPASFHPLRHAPHKTRSHMFYHRISMFYRFGLGVILLFLTLLNIGPFWTDADQTTPASPMFRLLNGTVYLPLLMLITLTAAVLDFVSLIYTFTCSFVSFFLTLLSNAPTRPCFFGDSIMSFHRTWSNRVTIITSTSTTSTITTERNRNHPYQRCKSQARWQYYLDSIPASRRRPSVKRKELSLTVRTVGMR